MLLHRFFKNRIGVFLLICGILFCAVIVRLYLMQILNGQKYADSSAATVIRSINTSAPRGTIYDKYGRVLAQDKVSYKVTIDLSIEKSGNTDEIERLLNAFKNYGVKYSTEEAPVIYGKNGFEYNFSSESTKSRWFDELGLDDDISDYTAEETFEYLCKYFNITESLNTDEKIEMIDLMCKIRLQRYKKYQSVTAAENVSDEFIAYLEENSSYYPGVFVEQSWYRYYPYGECMAHILGYTGNINSDELEEYSQYGYSSDDKIGKSGIEKTYELELRGTEGIEIIEVDAYGRRVSQKTSVKSQKGKDIYLTVDAELQKYIYETLEENLKNVLFDNLSSGKISMNDVIASMAENNILDPEMLLNAQSGAQLKAGDILRNNGITKEKTDNAGKILAEEIKNGGLSPKEFTQCLLEQEIITLADEDMEKFQNNSYSAQSIIKGKIESNEIAINKINADPCTGCAVVEDVNTGKILAMVSFPSYDNNKLANDFDSEYYSSLLRDETSPLINRATMERKAPGSIFKMISAVTGLEEGVINENTVIYDKGVFKDAGVPYANCLIYTNYGITHGAVDVKKALEVSCNYYFYEMSLRLNNENDKNSAIETLNKYMEKFGLNDYSGVEIEEYKPQMASPEAKENFVNNYYEEPSESALNWNDGDTIRTAIGQSYNNYSAVNIAKYISALANGKYLYKSTLIEGTGENGTFKEAVPSVEEELGFSQENIDIVHEGMLQVTTGSQGTLRNYFSDFPVLTAAKTGTAEENKNRPSHSWFAGFAPFDDPQIAVVVLVPFGEGSSAPAIKTAKDIIQEYMGYNQIYDSGNIFESKLAE